MTRLIEGIQSTLFNLHLLLAIKGALIWVKSRTNFKQFSCHILSWKGNVRMAIQKQSDTNLENRQLKSYTDKTSNTQRSHQQSHCDWLPTNSDASYYSYCAGWTCIHIILRFCAAIVTTRCQRQNKTMFWLHQNSQTEKRWAREDLKHHRLNYNQLNCSIWPAQTWQS